MKITCLGTGTWGFCLATLLSAKGYDVISWCRNAEMAELLNRTKTHPQLPEFVAQGNITFTHRLEEAIRDTDLIMESVTSAGVRPVFKMLSEMGAPKVPIVMTSKGIEQGSGALLSDVVVDILGEEYRSFVGCLSGPSHAEEVVRGLPTSVVGSAYDTATMGTICETFTTPSFRVYPNSDINGVEFGGAMKNVIAIACGISDGLGFGDNTKAALMTRGLHEIRKLGVTKGCKPETLNGLAGMGDLCVTCMSTFSRNYRFGNLIAQGLTPEQAQKEVGAVVEGVYSCVSALELSQQSKANPIPAPISEGVYSIVYKGVSPLDAVKALLQREIKEEHL